MRRATLVVVASLIGCSQGSSEPPPAANTASAPASRSAAPATAAPLSSIKPPGHAYADTDVPVPGDYAETVEKDITDANYKEQLEKLQSDVAEAMKAQGMKPTVSKAHEHEHEHDGAEKHAHPHDHAHGEGHAHDH